MKRGRKPGTKKQPHWKSTAQKHKSAEDREATMAEVARMKRSGFWQFEIAERLGLSEGQISLYLKELMERHAKSQREDVAEMVAEKWAQYDDVVREARLAWERSQESEDEEVRRAGDATFLRVQMEAWDAQRKLRGLDQPAKVDQRTALVQVDASAAPSPEQLSARPPRSDVLGEAVRALPAPKVKVEGVHANGKAK